MRARPASVRATSTPRPSESLGVRVISPLFEPVEPLGDRPGRDHRRLHQLCWAEAVWWSVAAQGREHVERRCVESVGAEGATELAADEPVEPGEAPDHRHRRHVEIGPLAGPLFEHAVHVIGHERQLRDSLAVKYVTARELNT